VPRGRDTKKAELIPRTLMAEQMSAQKPRSRRMYWMWGIALFLLVSTAIFCWLVVVPVMEVRAVARRVHDELGLDTSFVLGGFALDKRIAELGGAGLAAPKLSLYLRMPQTCAPHPEAGVLMLMECREYSSPYLVRFLRHEHPGVRARAAYALGTIAAPGRIEALIAALSDPDARVRYRAAHALGRIGDRRAVLPLVAVLKDESPLVRRWAVSALITIGDKRPAASLIPLLTDEDEHVR